MLISASGLNPENIKKHKIFFLFGNDEGLIHYSRQKIAKTFDPSAEHTSRYSYKEHKGNMQSVTDQAKACSLFGDLKVIIIDEISGNVPEKLLELFQKEESAIYILQAASIKKTSKLFKYFNEKRQDVLTAQCYQLEMRDIAKFAVEFMQKRGKTLSFENAALLASLLPPNLMMIERELEKLEIYAFNKPEISTEDINKVTDGGALLNIDEIFFNFVTNPAKSVKLLESMVESSDNMGDLILLLRSMQNLAKKLISMKIMLQNGDKFESAIMRLKPPVFFKFREKFTHLLKITQLGQLKSVLSQLNQLEKKVKLSSGNTLDHVGSYFLNRVV